MVIKALAPNEKRPGTSDEIASHRVVSTVGVDVSSVAACAKASRQPRTSVSVHICADRTCQSTIASRAGQPSSQPHSFKLTLAEEYLIRNSQASNYQSLLMIMCRPRVYRATRAVAGRFDTPAWGYGAGDGFSSRKCRVAEASVAQFTDGCYCWRLVSDCVRQPKLCAAIL